MTTDSARRIDRELRLRWGLGDHDPVPVSYPKTMFGGEELVPATPTPEEEPIPAGAYDSNQLAGGVGDDHLDASGKGDLRNQKYLLENGRYRLNPDYDPPFDISLGEAIAIPPLVGAAAALAPSVAAAAASAYRFARYGGELKAGRDLRIAPFGNRTQHPTGRWPHYHRRPSSSPPPGQSLKRHRPWDNNAADKSFWDRF